ncbi:hypothetical protein VARIO8X_110218 [Burkholderiales bacterium 8X]|nr:hypothetical protein VARIO8X_110218 [Burkholderiales bacterium 8X]
MPSTPHGFSFRQAGLHPGHYPGWQDFQAQRLGGTAGGRHVFIPSGRAPAGQPPELFPLVRADRHQRHQVRGREPRIARCRCDGLGFRHELRAGQRLAGRRGLPGAERAAGADPAAFANHELKTSSAIAEPRPRDRAPMKKPPEGGFHFAAAHPDQTAERSIDLSGLFA